jgi:hypothetical protein
MASPVARASSSAVSLHCGTLLEYLEIGGDDHLTRKLRADDPTPSSVSPRW